MRNYGGMDFFGGILASITVIVLLCLATQFINKEFLIISGNILLILATVWALTKD